MQHLVSLLVAALIAHPAESLLALGAVVSLVNGALPASVQRGPVGRVLHAVMDRAAVLTRSDARGTLKWPGVASDLLDAGVRALPSLPLAVALEEAPAPLAVVAEKAGAVAVSETRDPLRASTVTGRVSDDPVLDAARVSVRNELGSLMPPAPRADEAPFDPTARQTIVPPEPGQS